MSKPKLPHTILDDAIHKCKKAFIVTFFFAFGVNILALATSIYSLQVYDRVISSGSMETLLMLSLVTMGVYVALNMLQIARSLTLIRVGEWLDKTLAPQFFANSVASAAIRPSLGGSQTLRDLNQVRSFLTSAGINALFDAPWAIIFIIVLFAIHASVGFLALFGAAVLLGFAFLNAYATDTTLNTANQNMMKSLNQAEIATRNAESIEAMGMMSAVVKNWHNMNDTALNLQSLASNRNGVISTMSKFIRLVLQMAVTGMGAYYAINNEMTLGGIIASSMLIGRALAPVDSAIEVWKTITAAHKAYQRLQTALVTLPSRHVSMSLPTPQGRLSVENLFYAPPAAVPQANVKYTLRSVSFALEPGETLAVIGPSAAGKSSLARLLAGVWKPISGVVRLDSADVYTWNRDDFGQHVGYLPQGVELFNGTVKNNIARLQEDASPEAVVKAAQLAGVHDLILRLPNGYETDIGVGGSALSAGQRQRIGLARAFFGDPKFIILDEPNANLDESGEAALVEAIKNAKAQKITTVLISHRPSILSSVDKILVLQEGAVVAFGPRNEILAKFAARPTAVPQTAASATAKNNTLGAPEGRPSTQTNGA